MHDLEPQRLLREASQAHRLGRLAARPVAHLRMKRILPGVWPLRVAPRRDGLVAVPCGYDPDRPAPLVVALHDAGGGAADGLAQLEEAAAAAGFLVLAPSSRGRTWDFIQGTFGADVAFLDEALTQVFSHYAVDPARIAVAGFADGASYALTLGMANGDLFSRVLAFTPGFAAPLSRQGLPRLFVTHGTGDSELPIDRTSRKVVPRLIRAGYSVLYREFVGGHVLPPTVVEEGVRWLADGWNPPGRRGALDDGEIPD